MTLDQAFAGKRVRDDHCFEMRAVAADFKVRRMQRCLFCARAC